MEDKYFELHKDLEDLFTIGFAKTGLEHLVNLKVVGCKNQKTLTKVNKANDLWRYVGNEDVVITINELIFESLTKDLQLIAVDEALASISCNLETGKVTITKPDFSTYSTLLVKYGYDEYIKLYETVKSLYDSKANSEEPEEIRVD